MLRFSYYRSDDQDEWVLCGRLAGPWVDELGSVWRRIHERMPRARALIDLRDVTFIDESGERLLAEMQIGGARFLASGVEHLHLIANLRGDVGRTVRRGVEHLCEGPRPSAENLASADAAPTASSAAKQQITENKGCSGDRRME